MRITVLILFFFENMMLAKAQEKSCRVSDEFVEMPFNLFITRLEAQVPYHFWSCLKVAFQQNMEAAFFYNFRF